MSGPGCDGRGAGRGQATTTITQSGVGLRDLVAGRGPEHASAEVQVGDVVVRATAPVGTDVAAATIDAGATLPVLEAAFGPYPWSRLEVIEVPLGPQVGGMEWPGAIWIDGFGADAEGDIDDVVAHELAHEYWHALVGNDSHRRAGRRRAAGAVLDSASPATARGRGYEGCRLRVRAASRGAPCLDRRTDAFDPGEYGDLVYGEGSDCCTWSSRALIGFPEAIGPRCAASPSGTPSGSLSSAELRDELAAAVPDRAAEVTALWDRDDRTAGMHARGIVRSGREER